MKPLAGEVIHQQVTMTAREHNQLNAGIEDIRSGVAEIGKGAVKVQGGVRAVLSALESSGPDAAATATKLIAEKVGISVRHAQRLVSHVETIDRILEHLPECDPMGRKPECDPLGRMTERAIREVADLPAEQAAAVVTQATKDAKNPHKPTASEVAAAREKVAPKISGGTSFNVDELDGPGKVEPTDYSVEKKKACDAVGAAIRRLDDLNRVNRKNALHQKAMDGLHAAFEEVQKW